MEMRTEIMRLKATRGKLNSNVSNQGPNLFMHWPPFKSNPLDAITRAPLSLFLLFVAIRHQSYWAIEDDSNMQQCNTLIGFAFGFAGYRPQHNCVLSNNDQK